MKKAKLKAIGIAIKQMRSKSVMINLYVTN